MRADNTTFVIAAARRRSQATHRRAVAALRRMDTTRTAITFDALAREAGVSRSWLYSQPDLRAEIDRLRQRKRPNARPLVPERQRASEESLRRRLDLATERIRQLETDNQRLRRALSEALGDRRATHIHRSSPRHAGTTDLDGAQAALTPTLTTPSTTQRPRWQP